MLLEAKLSVYLRFGAESSDHQTGYSALEGVCDMVRTFYDEWSLDGQSHGSCSG